MGGTIFFGCVVQGKDILRLLYATVHYWTAGRGSHGAACMFFRWAVTQRMLTVLGLHRERAVSCSSLLVGWCSGAVVCVAGSHASIVHVSWASVRGRERECV